jgi:hypothetical protein
MAATPAPDESTLNKQKHRSPAYPSDGLETCYKWAKKIYEAERRNATSALIVVKHMGYSSLSGASRTGLSAMKKFGLVVEDGAERVRVSDEAVKLFLNPDEESRLALLRSMAQKPEIMKELLERYAGGLPSEDSLKYTLVTERGFGDEAANTFIRAFNETVRFAKLGNGQYTPPAKEQSAEPVQEQPNNSPPAPTALYPVIPAANEQRPGAVLHVWSLGGGVTVEVKSNAPLTPKHFKRLAKYVDLAAEAEEDDRKADQTDD